MSQTVEQHLAAVRDRIRSACANCDRDPEGVSLLAVSKTRPAAQVRQLHALGQKSFGENHVDEALEKMAALTDAAIEWHFIGPIQSNKTRAIAERFDWAQSLDRAKLVRRLDRQRPANLAPLQVLIQVNADDEPQKAGCAPDEIDELADRIVACRRLRLRGLMAIPAPRERFDDQLAVFGRLRALFDRLRRTHSGVDTLSAGMSNDLEAAIAAGSTLVRVGTALFGPRRR